MIGTMTGEARCAVWNFCGQLRMQRYEFGSAEARLVRLFVLNIVLENIRV